MRSRLYLSLIIFSLIQYGLSGQVGSNSYHTTKSLSMGSVGVGFTGVESIFSNPAGSTNVDDLEVLLYADNRFSFAELGSASIGVVKAINPLSNFGVMVSNFGLEEYKEQVIGLHYARKIIDKLSIGLKFNYLQTQIEGFGSRSNYTYEIGLSSMLTDKLRLGGHILSGNNSEVSQYTDIPSRLSLGLAYLVQDNLQLHVDFVKFTDEAFDLRYGIEYGIHTKLKIRAGGSTNPAVFSGGIAYQFKRLSIELGNQYHSRLQGITPGLGIVYRPSK